MDIFQTTDEIVNMLMDRYWIDSNNEGSVFQGYEYEIRDDILEILSGAS